VTVPELLICHTRIVLSAEPLITQSP